MAWSTTLVAGIWVTCIAMLLLAVGFSIPFWLSFTLTATVNGATVTYNAYLGIWYAMACINGEADSCKTEVIVPKYTTDTTYDNMVIEGQTQELIVENAALILGHQVWWWVVQIVTTVGLGFVILAALILICCRCAGIHSKGFFLMAAILLFFGGLLSLTISILIAIAIGYIFTFAVVSITAETFPWSVMFFGIGAVLAMIGSVILMYVTCKWHTLGKYRESDADSIQQNNIPMSNLSKSYDRPRIPYDSSRREGYDDRRYNDNKFRDQSRDFASSKKYRDTGRDYSRDYNTRDSITRDYNTRDYNTRDYDRSTRDYDRRYTSNDRSYGQSYGNERSYNDDYDKNISQSRSNDNMYRPYIPYKY